MLNTISFIVTVVIVIVLFSLSRKSKILRYPLFKIMIGVFFSLSLHSFAELLEFYNIIEISILIKVMPIFVIIGSLFIFSGCRDILYLLLNPLVQLTKSIKDKKINAQMLINHPDKNNEIGVLFNAILNFATEADISRKKIENITFDREARMCELKKEIAECKKGNQTLTI